MEAARVKLVTPQTARAGHRMTDPTDQSTSVYLAAVLVYAGLALLLAAVPAGC